MGRVSPGQPRGSGYPLPGPSPPPVVARSVSSAQWSISATEANRNDVFSCPGLIGQEGDATQTAVGGRGDDGFAASSVRGTVSTLGGAPSPGGSDPFTLPPARNATRRSRGGTTVQTGPLCHGSSPSNAALSCPRATPHRG